VCACGAVLILRPYAVRWEQALMTVLSLTSSASNICFAAGASDQSVQVFDVVKMSIAVLILCFDNGVRVAGVVRSLLRKKSSLRRDVDAHRRRSPKQRCDQSHSPDGDMGTYHQSLFSTLHVRPSRMRVNRGGGILEVIDKAVRLEMLLKIICSKSGDVESPLVHVRRNSASVRTTATVI
jgi:hypothetical protein